MNRIAKRFTLTALALVSFAGLAAAQPTTANASKVHYVKWNKPMKHHQVAVNGRKSSWKGYTLKKVSNKHYRFKTAAKLSSSKYQVNFLTTLRHAKIDHSIYYGVRIGKKGKMVWVNRNYLTGWVKTSAKKSATSSKATTTSKTTTASKSKSTAKKSGSKTTSTGKMYVNATKHITWSQWLNLPAFGTEGNGIPLYNVDNVPYDEDGFPYVSNKMGSASPIEVTQIKSEFTSAAYAAIPDKSNTYYLSDKNALYHPTNPEVGQAIRDKIPDTTNFDNAKESEAAAGHRVADISSNVYIVYLAPGQSKHIIMWAGTYNNIKLSDTQLNSYTITSANSAIATAPTSISNGNFDITALSAGDTSFTVRSVNNPDLSERIDVHVK
ncbi:MULTISPECIES: hypothetical protein [Lactobacillaceae]|uniref:hypothetical protein n=1 Tax=Lactobacillaceae TaxID=33958 RepID=UPI0014566FB8|nr:hypothetical protein [Lactobacillus sp. HBUAS51381]NLR08867.1 hypothetical protein [Lactobacillus sp. HBUAS51381]